MPETPVFSAAAVAAPHSLAAEAGRAVLLDGGNALEAMVAMAAAIADHMAKNGVKTVGYIGFNDAYGEGWLSEFQAVAAKKGLKIVATDLKSFQELLTSRLTTAPNVTSVKTSLTMRTSKALPGIPVTPA